MYSLEKSINSMNNVVDATTYNMFKFYLRQYWANL